MQQHISGSRAAIAIVSAGFIFAGMALAPASAGGRYTMRSDGHKVRSDKAKTCNSANPCAGGQNVGSGIGLFASAAANDAAEFVGARNGLTAYTNNQSKSTGFGKSGIYVADNSTDGGSFNHGLTAYSPYGTAIYAQSVGGTALTAYSARWFGLVAQSDTGYPFLTQASSGNPELPLWVIAGMSDTNHDAIETYNGNSTQIFRVDDAGNAQITGKIYTAGGCANGCSRTRGGDLRVVSYAPRESLPTMEDTGEARLVNGSAYVHIDAALANVIDRRAGYSVLVTPEGDSRGVYIAQKSAEGFEVRENQGGRSTFPFGYRIVAKPYGEMAGRLPMVAVPLNRRVPLRR